jgi:hypothetical protein
MAQTGTEKKKKENLKASQQLNAIIYLPGWTAMWKWN